MLESVTKLLALTELIKGIGSMLAAAAVIGLIALGVYLLFAPGDSLVVRYHNYRLQKTMRPLKDEDFGCSKTLVRRLRLCGVCSVFVAGGLLTYLAASMELL